MGMSDECGCGIERAGCELGWRLFRVARSLLGGEVCQGLETGFSEL